MVKFVGVLLASVLILAPTVMLQLMLDQPVIAREGLPGRRVGGGTR